MNEELQVLLAECERRKNFPVAARLLGDAVQQLVAYLPTGDCAQDGSLPFPVLQQFPLADKAMRVIHFGLTPSRAQLRELAELEHYLENLVLSAPEREKRRKILVHVTRGASPVARQNSPDSNPAGRDGLLLRYCFAIATVIFAFIGVAAIPTALTWGDIAWAMVGSFLPLAFLFAYCWWKSHPR